MIIAVISQKGGVGKSSIARTLAVEYTRSGWQTLLADIDSSQITSNRWSTKRRDISDIKPKINTQVFNTTSQAIGQAHGYDLMIIDGAPHATIGTMTSAQAADLVILPVATSLDDLEPTILLANELAAKVDRQKILFVIFRPASEPQFRTAKLTIEQCGYEVVDSFVPYRASYIDAFDHGRCATETRYPHLNNLAADMVNAVAARLNHIRSKS